jgi:DNA-binding transcriptional ArsR family regulator
MNMGIFSKLSQLFRKREKIEKERSEVRTTPFSDSQLIFAGAGLEQIREIKTKVDNIDDWLRYEGVTRSWFKEEFKDETPELLKKLDVISKKLEKIENTLEQSKILEERKPLKEEPLKEFAVIREPERIKYEYVLTPVDMEIIGVLSRAKKPLNFTELMEKVSISRQTLSNHLKELIRIGKIDKKREGKFIYYFMTKK